MHDNGGPCHLHMLALIDWMDGWMDGWMERDSTICYLSADLHSVTKLR